MQILGLISSPEDPASRARIIQYKDYFTRAGVSLTPRFFLPEREANPAPWTYRLKKITGISEWRSSSTIKILARLPLLFQQKKYDIIWQNRLLLPHHFYFEKKISKPLVFDYDDAIWLNEGEKQVAAAITKSAMVFAGNEYLAGFAAKHNKNVQLIPTTVDTKKLFPLDLTTNQFTLGWIGTKSNFKYLDIIKPALLDFLTKHKDARFIIVSSEKPGQFNFDNEQIIFKPWSAEKENELINEFSVGLMPLKDTEWTRGKCSYKMLQYMACGKPVVVSPVGMNNKILDSGTIGMAANNTSEWLNAFTTLKDDKGFYATCCLNGRSLVEKNYSAAVYTPVIINHFKKLLA
jgi:glycosyltransferase involved in cell wall biosynthesis